MLLFRGALCGKYDAVALKEEPVNEVVNRFANKRISGVISAEKFIAIDFQSASGGGPVGGLRFIEAFKRAARWIELIRVSFANWINPRLRRRDVWITAQIMFGHRKMPNQRAVIAAKPVAKIVSDTTLLAQPADRVEIATVGFNAKIAAT